MPNDRKSSHRKFWWEVGLSEDGHGLQCCDIGYINSYCLTPHMITATCCLGYRLSFLCSGFSL